MPRRLIVLNVILGLVSLTFTVGIVRSLLVKRPVPPPATVRTVTPAPPPPAAAPVPKNPEAYAIIAAENLFNPARSEKATVAVGIVRPILHGLVIEGTKSRAFLEDPTMKRVGAYSVGDAVSGGTLQKIADDRVVIARPEGLVEVLLQDPSKPKPVPVVAAGPPVAAPRAAPPEGIPSGPAVTVQPPASGAVPPGPLAPVQVPPAQVGPSPTGAPPADQSSTDLYQLRRRLLRLSPPSNQ